MPSPFRPSLSLRPKTFLYFVAPLISWPLAVLSLSALDSSALAPNRFEKISFTGSAGSSAINSVRIIGINPKVGVIFIEIRNSITNIKA